MYVAKVFFFDTYDQFTHKALMVIPGLDVSGVRKFVAANLPRDPLGAKTARAVLIFDEAPPIMVTLA